jgi:hypothetical protein
VGLFFAGGGDNAAFSKVCIANFFGCATALLMIILASATADLPDFWAFRCGSASCPHYSCCSRRWATGTTSRRRSRPSLRSCSGGSPPALESIVLQFDHYGRLAGIEVTDAADSVLPPALLNGVTPP